MFVRRNFFDFKESRLSKRSNFLLLKWSLIFGMLTLTLLLYFDMKSPYGQKHGRISLDRFSGFFNIDSFPPGFVVTPELVQVERKWRVNFVESGCLVQTRETTTKKRAVLCQSV